jgi:8-oxo-dGTP pyrophosphatase MutT (NUDIX family)
MTDLPDLIRLRLAGRSRRSIDDRGLRRAAVLVPLFDDRGEPQVLFTRRTDTVEHHKGQISFPGGAADPGDPSALATALRETEEELGIPGDRIQVLGMLDDLQATVSGFLITPSVGIIPHPFPLRINRAEIADVLTVPLRIFRDPSKLRVEERERGGQRVDVFFYTHGPHEIWGVTARIMNNFIDAVFAEDRQ